MKDLILIESSVRNKFRLFYLQSTFFVSFRGRTRLIFLLVSLTWSRSPKIVSSFPKLSSKEATNCAGEKKTIASGNFVLFCSFVSYLQPKSFRANRPNSFRSNNCPRNVMFCLKKKSAVQHYWVGGPKYCLRGNKLRFRTQTCWFPVNNTSKQIRLFTFRLVLLD